MTSTPGNTDLALSTRRAELEKGPTQLLSSAINPPADCNLRFQMKFQCSEVASHSEPVPGAKTITWESTVLSYISLLNLTL